MNERRQITEISHNIAPTNQVTTVIRENPTILTSMRWGLITGHKRYPDHMINARSEKMFVVKLYVDAISSRRCIIPSSGFYEWKAAEGINQNKTPHYISLKDTDVFSFAGIYSNKSIMDKFLNPKNSNPEIANNLSCSILTTVPNDLMTDIHNRMPVIIRREDEERWLDPDTNPKELVDIFESYPAELMEVYPVSTFMNSPKNNSERCVIPVNADTVYREKFGFDENQSSLDDFF